MAHITDRWYKKDRTRTDRYGKGLRWQVEWTDGDGKKRKKSFELKDLAENYLIEIRHEMKRGIYRKPETNTTVESVFTQWIESNPNAPINTVKAKRSALRILVPSIGYRPVDGLTRKDIQNAINGLLLDYSPNTVYNAGGFLSSALKWAQIEGITSTNPYIGVRLPKVPKKNIVPLTIEQIHALSRAAPTPTIKAMVLFGATTGLRISEIRAVSWDRIRRGVLTVDRQLSYDSTSFETLKSDSSMRKIRLGEKTLAILTDLRDQIGEGNDRLVFHREPEPFTSNHVQYAWRVMRDKAAIQSSGWHDLRHFHASQLIHAGFSPVAVAHRLGHRDASTTLSTYAHLWPSDDGAMAQLSDQALALPSPSEREYLRAIPG